MAGGWLGALVVGTASTALETQAAHGKIGSSASELGQDLAHWQPAWLGPVGTAAADGRTGPPCNLGASQSAGSSNFGRGRGRPDLMGMGFGCLPLLWGVGQGQGEGRSLTWPHLVPGKPLERQHAALLCGRVPAWGPAEVLIWCIS